jgi:hypothetical protein
VLRISKLKVKEVEPQGDHQLERHLSKSFAETDSDATQEGCVSERASPAAIRLLVPVTLRVETIWLEKLCILPLFGVITNRLEIDVEGFSSFDIDSTNAQILSETRCRR